MNPTTIVVLAIALIAFGIFRRLRSAGPSREAIAQLIADGVPVVDVRTPEEYAAGHRSGAINVPLADIGAGTGAAQVRKLVADPGDPIVLYCRTGNRSGVAIMHLRRAGLTGVLNAGGLSRLP